jgi:hypothetical protein
MRFDRGTHVAMLMLMLMLMVVVGSAACGSSHDVAGPRLDGGPEGGVDSDAGPVVPEGPVVCAGNVCDEGDECCTLTGECFDPADASACVVPAGETTPGACASNADCAPDEMCDAGGDMPIGPFVCTGGLGICAPRRYDACNLPGPGNLGVCGCDGRTYPAHCFARLAGVRVVHNTPCGRWIGSETRWLCDSAGSECPEGFHCTPEECVPDDPMIACGLDEQCPSGQRCCAMLGYCVESDCADCCRLPPVGTSYPCRTDEDCGRFVLWGMPPLWCGGMGCGPEGGGCMRLNRSECTGELAAVCGCDGRSYANACWAEREAVRIDHLGECDSP